MPLGDPITAERLPTELLILIFQAWKSLCTTKRYGLCAEWVRATWVCKKWREVALDAATLWSSVLVSRPLADEPSLNVQLDRARGAALDLSVSGREMSKGELEKVFSFVSSKKSVIKQLHVTFEAVGQLLTVKEFVQDVGTDIATLSLTGTPIFKDGEETRGELRFTSDFFPRLRYLALNSLILIPAAPLPTLTELDLLFVYDDHQHWFLHRFLTYFPNLESLRLEFCYVVPEQYSEDNQPVVSLPRLRHLSMDTIAQDAALTLHSLRLTPSTSFHITADCEGHVGIDDLDYTTCVIPRNISQSLPSFRHTRCLSLIVGQPEPRRDYNVNEVCEPHLSFRGSLGDTFEDGPDWSVTMISLMDYLNTTDRQFYYLGQMGWQFINAHIPQLVVQSDLVELRLHFAHGLPISHNWTRFFAPMSQLRTLAVGGGALVMDIMGAFEADPALCPELQDVALCIATGPGPVREESGTLLFFRDVVGSWVRNRAGAGRGLQTLTVRTPEDASRCASDDGENGLGGVIQQDASEVETVGFVAKLQRGLARLGSLVGKVVVEVEDCPACSMELSVNEPVSDPHWQAVSEDDEGSSGEDDGGSSDEDDPYFY